MIDAGFSKGEIEKICSQKFRSKKEMSPQAALFIGKWKDKISESRYIEFFEDMTFIVTNKTISIGGMYRFLDDGRLKLDTKILGTEKVNCIKLFFRIMQMKLC